MPVEVIIRKFKEKKTHFVHVLGKIYDLHDHGWFQGENQISLKQN